jgi:hypothetical protein
MEGIVMDGQYSDQNEHKEEAFKIHDVSDEALLRAVGTGLGAPTKFECGLYPTHRC